MKPIKLLCLVLALMFIAAGCKKEPTEPTEPNEPSQQSEVEAKTEDKPWEPTKSLHEAAADGDIEQVQFHIIVLEGADVNARPAISPSWTPLHEAAVGGHKDVAELLIAHGADVNANCARAGGGRFGGTPLHEAVFGGHKDVAELLISKGADINAKQSGGLTPLDVAAFKGHINVVELLIARGADVNITDRGGRTALRWAKHGRHPEIVELLQEHGAKE